MKLNVVNILVVISGILSLIGAYGIQVGAKMHELNYVHQKHITHLVMATKAFEFNEATIEDVDKQVLQIQDLANQCLEFAGPARLFLMKLTQTEYAIQLCRKDLASSEHLLREILAYKNEQVNKTALLNFLYRGIEQYEHSGVLFDPLIADSVEITFFVVISIAIGNAFIVPLFGLLLSRSVAQDYKILSETKAHLEEEKRRSALIQSERLSSLTIVVAGVAHEINTPVGVSITANSYSVELLDKLQESYEAGELTEEDFCLFFKEMEQVNSIVRDNLSRTATLVESFKQVSVDQTVDHLQVIELKPYIERILVSLTPLTKKLDVVINLACDAGLKANIYVGALTQIVTNLVTNTIKHAFKDSHAGTILITLKGNSEDEILMSFSDDGCGISEIDLIHIFDPFFTTKRANGGTGLGLHILHNLVVDKLKGRVLCSSELGKGTKFDIYFPVGINTLKKQLDTNE